MRIVPSYAIVLAYVSRLLGAARRVVMVSRPRGPSPRRRVAVLSTKLFPAFPTPRPTAARSHHKAVLRIEPARKNVITSRVFQAPAGAPRTLFGIDRHFLEGLFTFLTKKNRDVGNQTKYADYASSCRLPAS
jgi:hypothetical protein